MKTVRERKTKMKRTLTPEEIVAAKYKIFLTAAEVLALYNIPSTELKKISRKNGDTEPVVYSKKFDPDKPKSGRVYYHKDIQMYMGRGRIKSDKVFIALDKAGKIKGVFGNSKVADICLQFNNAECSIHQEKVIDR